MNNNCKHYFDIHQNVNEFFFTSDNLAFFKDADARNHAGNLKDKAVTKVTREEVNAWWAGAGPEQVAAAEKELEDATAEQTKAQEAVDALPKTTTAAKKAPVMRALNDAKARVNAAQVALEEAKELMGTEKEEAPKDLEIVITEEDLVNNPDLVTDGVKVGETVHIPVDAIITDPVELANARVSTAQAAYDAAVTGGNEEEITTTKKALTVAKMQAGKAAKKASK